MKWVKGGGDVWGDLCMLLASLTWAFFTVSARFLMKEYSSLKVTAYIMLIGSLLFLPFLPNENAGGWSGVSALGWGERVLCPFRGICWPISCGCAGFRTSALCGPFFYQYLTPVRAILFAVPFLNETLTPSQIGGALIVFTGVFLARS